MSIMANLKTIIDGDIEMPDDVKEVINNSVCESNKKGWLRSSLVLV